MPMTDDAVRALVYRSCLALDDEDFAAYLALCGEEMRYRIACYSPEIGKDVILMNHDRAGLAALFESLPDHIKLPGRLMRHASVYEIARDRDGAVAAAKTSLVVIRTDPEGLSHVFTAGRYHDTIDVTRPVPMLTSRTMRLHTRDIGIGTEVPF